MWCSSTSDTLTRCHGTATTENEIINIIDNSPHASENKAKAADSGYSLYDLQTAAKALGYAAQWRKIPVKYLPMINQPVILLADLQSAFPHFVVLKGVRNQIVYIADPIRGNIRIPYSKFIESAVSDDSLDKRYWYVMAVNPPEKVLPQSSLALSKSEEQRLQNHISSRQAILRDVTTLSKEGQTSFYLD